MCPRTTASDVTFCTGPSSELKNGFDLKIATAFFSSVLIRWSKLQPPTLTSHGSLTKLQDVNLIKMQRF